MSQIPIPRMFEICCFQTIICFWFTFLTFKDGAKNKIPSEISQPFKVSHADEEDIETEDEESRGSDTTEEKRIGSTLCSLIGVSNTL